MTAGISVNLRSPVPPFEQIRAQIASLIAIGALAPGTRLPAVRSLAGDLGLAAGTVARAYKELEQAGLVETRRRNGTVVAGRLPPSAYRLSYLLSLRPPPLRPVGCGPGRGDRRRRPLSLPRAARPDSTTAPYWESCRRGSSSDTNKERAATVLSRLEP